MGFISSIITIICSSYIGEYVGFKIAKYKNTDHSIRGLELASGMTLGWLTGFTIGCSIVIYREHLISKSYAYTSEIIIPAIVNFVKEDLKK